MPAPYLVLVIVGFAAFMVTLTWSLIATEVLPRAAKSPPSKARADHRDAA